MPTVLNTKHEILSTKQIQICQLMDKIQNVWDLGFRYCFACLPVGRNFDI